MKKINGDRADDHYTRFHPINGTLNRVEPEFITMSNDPGIGRNWFDKFKSDVFPSDFLVVEGRQTRVPRYYDKLLKEEELQKSKRKRKRDSLKRRADNTPARRRVREQVKIAQLNNLKRNLKDH